jgi:HNH endonuclease/AP2 domain
MGILTQQRLRTLLEYNPFTGEFINRVNRGRSYKGQVAGGRSGRGYIYICIDQKKYLAHRLAWLYMTGSMPESIDHRDGDLANNRWSNIRGATQSQNLMNRKSPHQEVGLPRGVYYDSRRRKFAAAIQANRERFWLGYHGTAAEASRAYQEAAERLHGPFAYHNRPLRRLSA